MAGKPKRAGRKSFASRTAIKMIRLLLRFSLFILFYFFLSFSLSLASIEDRLEYYEDGISDFEDEDYEDAIENFKRFLKEQPYMYEVRDALFYLGESYMKENDYLEAVSQFNTLSTKYPDSKYRKTILFKKGKCYYKLNITAKAGDI